MTLVVEVDGHIIPVPLNWTVLYKPGTKEVLGIISPTVAHALHRQSLTRDMENLNGSTTDPNTGTGSG